MKFYLSSYRLGNDAEKGLKGLFPRNNWKVGYISNAIDFSKDLEKRRKTEQIDVEGLAGLGLEVEHVDLRNYFGQSKKLREKISGLGAIWVSGGSVFVLRQAMKLSGMDELVGEMSERGTDFLYGGYSAGVCVLAPTLKGYEIYELEKTVLSNDSAFNRYKDCEFVWEGLGLLNYSIVPHYTSEHPESAESAKVIEYMINNKMLFKALRDGEVIIFD